MGALLPHYGHCFLFFVFLGGEGETIVLRKSGDQSQIHPIISLLFAEDWVTNRSTEYL